MTPIAYYTESAHPDDGMVIWIPHPEGDILAGVIPPEEEDEIQRLKEVLQEEGNTAEP